MEMVFLCDDLNVLNATSIVYEYKIDSSMGKIQIN